MNMPKNFVLVAEKQLAGCVRYVRAKGRIGNGKHHLDKKLSAIFNSQQQK
jgi:hypothetical protein|tara:strand:- start:1753 stop:1902 length:150 start_codon:yes stop_codon:yes gene_type:complete